jgi:two-component system response regulator NreC
MKQDLKILMVDDHPVIIEAYKNILDSSGFEEVYNFSIDTAINCDTAIEKIDSSAIGSNYDVLFLDIQLPPSFDGKIISGEDLAVYAKKKLPEAKIIILTTFNDSHRIRNILKIANPDAFLIKDDLNSKELLIALKTIMSNNTYYSNTVSKYFRKQSVNFGDSLLDEVNQKIIYYLSKGIKTKDLPNHVPLSLSAIEKRKAEIVNIFELNNSNVEQIIIEAKKRGFI